MKTPNVYCATCSLPQGTGRQDEHYFCGEYCQQAWPGLHAARNALIIALVYSGARSMQETARLFNVSRWTVHRALRGQ